MRVLITGHNGYIGSVMTRLVAEAGHDVVGLDAYFFEDCGFGPDGSPVPAIRVDVRDVEASHLAGFDAVIHLAAISNDPVGNLNPQGTYDINHLASVRLARRVREAGVSRFLFASSCSLYGVAGDGLLKEDAAFNPITPYGESKVLVERDVSALATDAFSPVFLRNATAYGVSPRLRVDVVVNSLVGYAFTTGEILIQSDGTPWRPLVHIEDISRAFLAVLHAPRGLVHDEAYNVGASAENYTIRQVAETVAQVVPGARASFAESSGPDKRSYRVDCSKLARVLPDAQPRWTVASGAEEMARAYEERGMSLEDFSGPRYLRIKRVSELQEAGRLDHELRWLAPVTVG